MSTTTIYAHRFDAPNHGAFGLIGGAQQEANTPHTRKLLLRTAMGTARAGVFDVLLGLARRGLGGSIAGGLQYISWSAVSYALSNS